jgi:hypothetical protein
MKKLVFAIAALLLIGCSKEKDVQQTEQAIKELMESYAKEHTRADDDIIAEYDEAQDEINITYKGKMMRVCYALRFKDLLTDNPQSYAERFLISMVLFDSRIKNVSDIEFKIEGISFKMNPYSVKPIGKYLSVGFTRSEESFCKTMDILSHPHGILDAWLNTNIGKIEIPLYDITNLQAMALSYRLDGGTFE